MWLLGWVCRWACALYNACSRVVVSCSALNAGNAKEASGQAVLVYGRSAKTASLGSWDMYSFFLRERVMGLQYMTLSILKQLHNVSYKVSGMGHGSSYSSCWFCFYCLCSFRSFVTLSS
jgi:hypothetical protein